MAAQENDLAPDPFNELNNGDKLTTILQTVSDIKEVNICLVQASGEISYIYPSAEASNNTILLGQLEEGTNKIVSLCPEFEGIYVNFALVLCEQLCKNVKM